MFPYVSSSCPRPCSFRSSKDDIDDREVEEGDCRGVSFGDPAAVEGEDSVVGVIVRFRRLWWGTAVEDMLSEVCTMV